MFDPGNHVVARPLALTIKQAEIVIKADFLDVTSRKQLDCLFRRLDPDPSGVAWRSPVVQPHPHEFQATAASPLWSQAATTAPLVNLASWSCVPEYERRSAQATSWIVMPK